MCKEIDTKKLEEMIKKNEDIELIDVREKYEWELIRIPGSKLIPLSTIQQHVDEIDFSKKVYVFCRTGTRSGMVCNWLQSQGKDATNVAGSIKQLYFDNSDILEKSPDFNISYFN